jgi:hypothetical protein
VPRRKGDKLEELQMELDVYTLIMASVSRKDPEREKLASVAGYMAACGGNVSKTARRMGRSRGWVRARWTIVKELMECDEM